MRMVGEVVRAVARAIRELYPEAEIYTEEVKQGLTEPCFSICCTGPVMRRYMGNRWRCRMPVTVYCFLQGEDKNRELGAIFEQLYGVLELIDCCGPLRACGMHASVSDGVGIFCAEYDFFAEWEDTAEESGMMLELKLLQNERLN